MLRTGLRPLVTGATFLLVSGVAWPQPTGVLGYWVEGPGCFPVQKLEDGTAPQGAYLEIRKVHRPSPEEVVVRVLVERKRGFGCSFEGTGYWSNSRVVTRSADAESKCELVLIYDRGRIHSVTRPYELCKATCGMNADLDALSFSKASTCGGPAT
jgi:hypothetical protein